jgi:hypothetical protein
VLPLVISDSDSVLLPIARHDISKHANWLTQVKSKNSRPNEVCFTKLGYVHGALSNSLVSETKRPQCVFPTAIQSGRRYAANGSALFMCNI